MVSDYKEWDEIYQRYPLDSLGWELGRPRPNLVEFIEKCLVKQGKVLDLCCGAGTNTIYLAQSGFDVIGTDISPTAIKIARKKAEQAHVDIKFMVQSFLNLPFKAEEFDFVFDMGCFHHVKIEDRTGFIRGVQRILKNRGTYMLTCFSFKNGVGWNHFTRKQIHDFFSEYFEINRIGHFSSIEGDGFKRFFYTALMKKQNRIR